MVFIEKQRKGKSTYYYLTYTVRQGKKFKKVRVLLSEKPLPKAELQRRAKQRMRELQQKSAQAKIRSLFPTTVDESKLNDRYLIWERPCSIYLVYCAADAVFLPHIQEYGWSWGKTHGFFQNDMVKFVWDLKQFVRNGLHILNNMLQKEYFNQKMKHIEALTSGLKKLYPKNRNISHLSDAELLSQVQEFGCVFTAWWGATQVSEPLAAACEYLLKEVVNEKQLSIITTPSKKSYSTTEEEELVYLALLITKNKELSRLFMLDASEILAKISSFPELQQRLQSHVAKYYWLQNNYSTIKYCDELYFILQIKKILNDPINPALSLQHLEKRLAEIKAKRKQLLSSLSLDEKYKCVLKMAEYMSIFQDERKATSLEAHQCLYEFLKELARRTGIDIQLLLYSSPREFASILKGKFHIQELLQRQQGCVMVIDEEGIALKTGKEYQRLFQHFFGTKSKNDITEFEGRRAEGGKVLGKVRVILDPREGKNFQSGEILVTTMTSPDFLQLMKKAAAIVTDEGGITCHAAIVSRELGIPCVVGTRIATQVLHDGDTVEVNANHGLVRIRR